MSVIATLLPTAGHLQRLRLAIRDRHDVVACDDWTSLTDACERHGLTLPPLAGIILVLA